MRIQAGSQDDLPAYLSLHHRALVLSKGDMVQPLTICSAVDGAKALRLVTSLKPVPVVCLSLPARQTSVPDGGIYRVVSLFCMTRAPKEALGWPVSRVMAPLTVAETEV